MAVIDRHERVLLCRAHSSESPWRPVKAGVFRIPFSKLSVIHVLNPLFSHWFVAATPVIGRFDTNARGKRDRVTHIFVVRREKMLTLSLHMRADSLLDSDYSWHPLSDLEADGFEVYPRELTPLVRGFLEGWIPDGVISLAE